MEDWSKRFLELSFKLNQVCVHQDILQRNCISVGRMECRLLNYLHVFGQPVCMNDLAVQMNVSHSRVTRIVDNLVKKEYVRRYPSKEDRRRWYTEITEKGLEMAARSYQENLVVHRRVLELIPSDKFQQVYDSIQLYIAALQKIVHEVTPKEEE